MSLYLQAPCPDTYKGLHRKEPKLQDPGLAYANEVKHIIQRAHAGGRQVSGDIQLRFTEKFFISSMQIHFCFFLRRSPKKCVKYIFCTCILPIITNVRIINLQLDLFWWTGTRVVSTIPPLYESKICVATYSCTFIVWGRKTL